jgi:myo-inositol-1-phosphate synthase
MNYLPVGSQAASEFYAECALEAGVAFVNNIPVFIASNPEWANRFAQAGVPIIGDDIKAQLGATIVHRVLTDLFAKRGVKLERTYQLNTGGNTDFLNMSNHRRLASKKISKTEAVQSVAAERLEDDNVHIGPSDYVPWQNDNKVCFLRMEGTMFGGVPMNLELRLSVEDSPNSAGVAIDMIRCAKLAQDRGLAGPIDAASAYFCKHPRTQMTDDLAAQAVEDFIMQQE